MMSPPYRMAVAAYVILIVVSVLGFGVTNYMLQRHTLLVRGTLVCLLDQEMKDDDKCFARWRQGSGFWQ
jgi:hypothetical protein